MTLIKSTLKDFFYDVHLEYEYLNECLYLDNMHGTKNDTNMDDPLKNAISNKMKMLENLLGGCKITMKNMDVYFREFTQMYAS